MVHSPQQPAGQGRLRRRTVLGGLAAGAVALPGGAASAYATGPTGGRPADVRRLLLGGYTDDGASAGLRIAEYDATSGEVSVVDELAVENPSYLAPHPAGGTLYTVNEQDDGGLTALAGSADEGYRVLGTVPAGGSAPCQLAVHPSGAWLFSAHYGSGSVAVHPVAADGSLGAHTDLVAHDDPAPGPAPEQDGPHAHQLLPAPDGAFALACDLGTDTVYSYAFDDDAGALTEVSRVTLAAGCGPRHLTFHPDGAFAYLANELDDTVVVCAYDAATGTLTPGEAQSTGTTAQSAPAQFVVTADGAWAYLGNRGDDSVTRYAVEDGGARLRLVETVPLDVTFPRHLALSPDDGLLFVGGQRSNTLQVLRVAPESGELTPLGERLAVDSPVFLLPR